MQRFIALLLLATFLGGCASMSERKKTVTLDTATASLPELTQTVARLLLALQSSNFVDVR